MRRHYVMWEVAAKAIKQLVAGDEKAAYEELFHLHPDQLEELTGLAERLSELCAEAINDYPEPDIAPDA